MLKLVYHLLSLLKLFEISHLSLIFFDFYQLLCVSFIAWVVEDFVVSVFIELFLDLFVDGGVVHGSIVRLRFSLLGYFSSFLFILFLYLKSSNFHAFWVWFLIADIIGVVVGLFAYNLIFIFLVFSYLLFVLALSNYVLPQDVKELFHCAWTLATLN